MYRNGLTCRHDYAGHQRQFCYGEQYISILVNLNSPSQQNKSLSDSTDEILRLQGVGWFKRKLIAAGTVSLVIKHYKDENGLERIDIDQTLSPGGIGTREERVLDWSERSKDDSLFGAIIGQSKRLKVEEIDDDYLKNGWTADTIENGSLLQGRPLHITLTRFLQGSSNPMSSVIPRRAELLGLRIRSLMFVLIRWIIV